MNLCINQKIKYIDQLNESKMKYLSNKINVKSINEVFTMNVKIYSII